MLCGPLGKRRKRRDNKENYVPATCFPSQKAEKTIISPFKRLRVEPSQAARANRSVTGQIRPKVATDISAISPKRFQSKAMGHNIRFIDSGIYDQTTQLSVDLSKRGHSLVQDARQDHSHINKNSHLHSRAYPHEEYSQESGFATLDSIKETSIKSRCCEQDIYTDICSERTYISLNQAMMEIPADSANLSKATRENMLTDLKQMPHDLASESSQDHLYERIGQDRACNTPEGSLKISSILGSGQLKVSVQCKRRLLTVHVHAGQHLKTRRNSCQTYVQVGLMPCGANSPMCRTEVICDTNAPVYDEKFTFEVVPSEDSRRRLLISVWEAQPSGNSKLIGCMSFGLKRLMSTRKEVNGWYYLLPESAGHRKHLQASDVLKVKSSGSHSSSHKLPSTNRDINLRDTFTVVIKNTVHGYGFTVIGSSPVYVKKVLPGGPAASMGLREGDCIVRINGQNVSRSTSESIARLIMAADGMVILDIYRNPGNGSCDLMEAPQTLVPVDVHAPDSTSPIKLHRTMREAYPADSVPSQRSTENTCSRLQVDCSQKPSSAAKSSPNESSNSGSGKSYGGDERSYLDDTELGMTFSSAKMEPLPSLPKHNSFDDSMQSASVVLTKRQKAVHKLLECEENFVSAMQFGISMYCWPLKTDHLSPKEYSLLFQNMEKLATISGYFVSQLQAKIFDQELEEVDDTQFDDFIGELYKSKLRLMSEMYSSYCQGLAGAQRVRMTLTLRQDFHDFLNSVSPDTDQQSLEEFLQTPIMHLRSTILHLQYLLSCTPPEHPDVNDVKVVILALEEALVSQNAEGPANSLYSDQSHPSQASARSMNTVTSVDQDVVELEQRLHFPAEVQHFSLAVPQRHLIYSGELVWADEDTHIKLVAMLFSDMLLLCQEDGHGDLIVVESPFMFQDIITLDFNGSTETELTIVLDGASRDPPSSEPCYITLQAPSVEHKYTWKNLLEHRTCRTHSDSTKSQSVYL